MTNKQRILQMVERWPDDISYDKALYHLSVLQGIDQGLKDIEAGRTKDFDEAFEELERRWDEEESQAANVGPSRKRPGPALRTDETLAKNKADRRKTMTNKQRILQMVERWPEDISFDEAIYHVYVLKKIDAGLKDIEAGRWIDHDELFDELERLCDEEENQAAMAAASRSRPETAPKVDHEGRRAKNGKGVRKAPKKARQPAP
jgi:predicted transcriptional regulator